MYLALCVPLLFVYILFCSLKILFFNFNSSTVGEDRGSSFFSGLESQTVVQCQVVTVEEELEDCGVVEASFYPSYISLW